MRGIDRRVSCAEGTPGCARGAVILRVCRSSVRRVTGAGEEHRCGGGAPRIESGTTGTVDELVLDGSGVKVAGRSVWLEWHALLSRVFRIT